MELIAAYKTSVLVLGLTGLTFFIQLLVADLVSIKQKHVPGTLVEQSHSKLLFRVSRAFANSNETVGILLLFLAFAVLSAATPVWVNGFAVVYLVGRWGHMASYYADLKLLRSISFTISAIALFGLFAVGACRWF